MHELSYSIKCIARLAGSPSRFRDAYIDPGYLHDSEDGAGRMTLLVSDRVGEVISEFVLTADASNALYRGVGEVVECMEKRVRCASHWSHPPTLSHMAGPMMPDHPDWRVFIERLQSGNEGVDPTQGELLATGFDAALKRKRAGEILSDMGFTTEQIDDSLYYLGYCKEYLQLVVRFESEPRNVTEVDTSSEVASEDLW